MKFSATPIPGLTVIEPQVYGDERGWFMEELSAKSLHAAGLDADIQQVNHSFSTAGVLRGLHYQAPPHDQSKLVRCMSGRLFDVAVDIRIGSATYGQWFGIELSAENKRALFVPRGFAHGFLSLTDCELVYFCGHSGYDKASEGGLLYECPHVGIDWPVDGLAIQINERDRTFPNLSQLKSPFQI